jgi:hypothetical protein
MYIAWNVSVMSIIQNKPFTCFMWLWDVVSSLMEEHKIAKEYIQQAGIVWALVVA